MSSTSTVPTDHAVLASPRSGVIKSHLELTKARLSALVLLTTAAGFIIASPAHIDWIKFCWTMLGTALAAGCANALNQIIEFSRDRMMKRTQGRPLPSGSLKLSYCLVAAIVIGYVGLCVLAFFANLTAAALALITIVTYAAIYTPLKTRSSFNTFVGAICGAIPPMIGCAAVTGSLTFVAWWLAAILFIWQIPHFLALAWKYRDDYSRGGFIMLPAVDRNGSLTGRVMVVTTLLLIPLGVLGTFVGLMGVLFAIGSISLGFVMLIFALRFLIDRTDLNARRVFLASITYLPLIMILLVIDRVPVS